MTDIRPITFTVVIMVGLAVRLILAPFFAHPFDMYDWYVIGQSVTDGSQPITNFLAPSYYSYFLFVFPAASVFHLLPGPITNYIIPISSLDPRLNPGAPWDITLVPGLLFDLLIKIPLILSDTIVAFLLYRIVLRHGGSEKTAVTATLMWFLNPLVIWVSSGWGTYDTLPALFTVVCFYFLVERKFAFSGLALVVAIAMKYYALVLVIPVLVVAWRVGGRKGLLSSAIAALGASIILFLPLADRIVQGAVPVIVGPVQPGLTYSGVSFWSSLTLFVPLQGLGTISLALIAVSLVGIYYLMQRTCSFNLYSLATYFGLSIIPLLLLFRFVAENYFVWLMPFASIFALKSARSKTIVWILSFVVFLSSITDSLLPYYMLPMAPWIGRYLVNALSFAAPYRVASSGAITTAFSWGKLFLAGLGLCTTVLLLLIVASLMSSATHASRDGPSDGKGSGIPEIAAPKSFTRASLLSTREKVS